ncbi:hypothetical protein ZWY2020_054947 [Hordeum vulgare]|nr:hypothetical protein ZWY2020_054947 [Hordeum vulgare]
MAVRNGSAAHLLLPSGLVVLQAGLWHGAATEVLHTTVGEGPGGRPVIRGGVPWTSARPTPPYAVRLQGSDYRGREPLLSEFSILPPDYYAAPSSSSSRSRAGSARLDMLLSGGGGGAGGGAGAGREEDDNYKHLRGAVGRVYGHAPREFTVIDRVRPEELGLLWSRRGFEELYVFSPGSKYEWYGKFAYVCIGPAMLEPVVLPPEPRGKGAQCIRNPNL